MPVMPTALRDAIKSAYDAADASADKVGAVSVTVGARLLKVYVTLKRQPREVNIRIVDKT